MTYTWGRWQVDPNSNPSAAALDVRGVPWLIPAVHPRHFTVPAFQSVVRACTDVGPYMPGWHARAHPVEFLWLDVACIDQRPGGNLDTLSEIGRQAQIFDQAHCTFVWLTTVPYRELRNATDQLEEHITASRHVRHDTAIVTQTLRGIEKCLRTIFEDPWFSSLWTLQEAFLRPDAVLLSKEGIAIPHNAERYRTLGRLVERTATAYDFCHQTRHWEGEQWEEVRGICKTIMKKIDKVGLASLHTKNPLAAYVASRFRATSNESDRVYGIQQIFRFRLGATAQNYRSHARPNNMQLEDQLGEELLTKHAILSQFHVFKKPAKFGSAWRIGEHSAVENLVLYGSGNWKWDRAENCTARLTTKRHQDILWGHFEGKSCHFHDLREAWKCIDQRTRYNALIERRTSQSIFIDSTPDLKDCTEHSFGHYDPIPRTERQHVLARWLCKKFKDEDLRVLLLGTLTGPGYSSVGDTEPLDLCHNIGLLLLRKKDAETHYWHRLGFCAWELGHLTFQGEHAPEKDFLIGKGPKWQPLQGLFG
jgi:hypothetical protein